VRLAGVAGPYSLLLSADAWTAVSETSDHGLSHDADRVQLYFTESFTFSVYTTEASVSITA
jgi:uncharacterized linocin/CFP29 family protein